MKLLTKLIVFSFFSVAVLLVGLLLDDREIFIESAESKTPANAPVYNKIKWYSFKNKDVWMMNQSHYGELAPHKAWERLAIVIDKSVSPNTARFYQLGPGNLEWDGKIQKRPNKVACYMCHSNGPRSIRPNYSSSLKNMGLWTKLKVTFWNFKIKSYGRVVPHPDHASEDRVLTMPFRWRSEFENEPLKAKSCTICHKDSGFLARGSLRRQNIPTIKFMLSQGHMPPFGFSISEEDKLEIQNFLKGF